MVNENSTISSTSSLKEEEEIKKKVEELLQTLPAEIKSDGTPLYLYEGCWVPFYAIRGLLASNFHFQAKDNDILLASLPKSGTTWLKALIFSIVNRHRFTFENTPVLNTHPHKLMYFLEFDHYQNGNLPKDLDQLPQPRMFSSHCHYDSLPQSIKNSECKIVYVCRNPMDNLISLWHFLRSHRHDEQAQMDESFEKFCSGAHGFGPFWDSILGYWKVSLEKPEKVLFIKYEDMKEDIVSQCKILAKFLGFPFTAEEEEQGVVEEIVRLCSFENLKNLEVNENAQGLFGAGPSARAYFRKGEVGDYVNHLSPSMIEKMEKLMKEKFGGTGLVFKYAPKAQN
ncbi:hypothetical protein FEM48_Zijuj03G0014400 [Ziziphus jujuba var. spinosa]|uniref:Sulfotransferase n=1 Tax=Ziziphus jujuba var. spinosa TaxID=714518 RepID=A0A978VMC7_ZIZJJ|nr:cytosolic sulfotransferase 15-like [Ziziphus jujuba var. spinosa]KAH7536702.1 hypothetical protein FEM48_Zijuj03G0014400 [Ziziphus jujuba var. spinosa]